MIKPIIQKNIEEKISNNRFDLILTVAKRARQIQEIEERGMLKSSHLNKCTIVALKEIEKSLISE